MAKRQSGYIIPEEPQPDGYRCLRVFIPNDDIYLFAFMGAYRFFSTWVAWEKDGTNRASLAAASWSIAYEMTRQEMDMECIDMDTFEEIVDRCCSRLTTALGSIASEIGGISGTGGGCGCLPVGDTLDDDNEEVYDPDAGDIPAEFDDELDPIDSYNEAKCNNASAIADVLIASFRGLEGMSVTFLGLVSAATTLAVLTLIIPGGVVITAAGMLAIVGGLITLYGTAGFSWQVFGGIADYVDSNKDDLICAIYEANTSATAVAAITAIFQDGIDDVFAVETQPVRDAAVPVIVDILTYIVSNATVNNIFHKFSAAIFPAYAPPEWTGTCASCGGATGGGIFTFDTDLETWFSNAINQNTGGSFWQDDGGGEGFVRLTPRSTGNADLTATYNNTLSVFLPSASSLYITSVTFDMRKNKNQGLSNLHVRVHDAVGGTFTETIYPAASHSQIWESQTHIHGGLTPFQNETCIEFIVVWDSNANDDTWHIDNIQVLMSDGAPGG